MTEATRKRVAAATPVKSIRIAVVDGPDRGAQRIGEQHVSIGTAETNDLVLRDPTVSRIHVEVHRRGGAIVVTDRGSTNGTRVGAAVLRAAEATVDAGATLVLGDTRLVVEDGSDYVLEGTGPDRFGELLGRSSAMRSATHLLERVAASDASVLLQGESGTGKELAARAIHAAGARHGQPFVAVDCAALPPSLFASELFGHEKGAFTGADRKHLGAFERANGGTLFLDEIGDLGADLQAALLGALERRQIRRVGGATEIALDVRVLAATHRDLQAAVNSGEFRLDLYYRLATVRVTMPPLRERPEDVPLLVRRFLDESGRGDALASLFDESTMRALQRHAWPGNVRELRNVVHAAMVLGEPPTLASGVGEPRGADPVEAVLHLGYAAAKRALLDVFEERWLRRLVERTEGNVRAASREGGIERKHLIDLLQRHGIRP